MTNNESLNKYLFKKAFIKSIPVLVGYIFLGTGFGVLMAKAGFNALWCFIFSLTMYAGSLEFALVSFLTNNTAVIIIAIACLLINFRHIFYGISFVDEFKKMGKKKWYMIFALTDETYSLLVSIKPEINFNNKDDQKFVFLMSMLNHSYWIIGSVIGNLVGTLIPFDFNGIDFVMTALFIVILLNGLKGIKENFKVCIPALIGLIISLSLLFIMGPDNFLVPSLIITSLVIIIKNIIFKDNTVKSNIVNDNKKEVENAS